MIWTKEKLEETRRLAAAQKAARDLAMPGVSSLVGINHEPIHVKTTVVEAGFETVSFTVPGEVVGKPRMTRRDKWQKRECVLHYRDYCDRIRAAAGEVSHLPDKIRAVVYIAMPTSWSQRKKQQMNGQPHQSKPDSSNIIKGIEDALFEEDSCLWAISLEKFWCWSEDARTEVTVFYAKSKEGNGSPTDGCLR